MEIYDFPTINDVCSSGTRRSAQQKLSAEQAYMKNLNYSSLAVLQLHAVADSEITVHFETLWQQG